ncbi:hypothetical protein B0T09DRAFT_330296, partial [Sordaria sp. MPI-SDFR-AT-0083]
MVACAVWVGDVVAALLLALHFARIFTLVLGSWVGKVKEVEERHRIAARSVKYKSWKPVVSAMETKSLRTLKRRL